MKGLLFDFGGTIDTNGVHWSEEFWDAYQRAGIRISKADFENAYVSAEKRMSDTVVRPGDTLRTTLGKQIGLQFESLNHTRSLHDRATSPELPARIAGECYERVRRTIDRLRPVLEACSRRFVLGLVSNFYGNLGAVCAELRIDSLFKVIIDSTEVGVRKPDPRIFQIAIDKLAISTADTLVVGDSYDRDIVPAKGLGCMTIWLRGRSWTSPSDTSSADYVIYSLDAVGSFLSTARYAERP